MSNDDFLSPELLSEFSESIFSEPWEVERRRKFEFESRDAVAAFAKLTLENDKICFRYKESTGFLASIFALGHEIGDLPEKWGFEKPLKYSCLISSLQAVRPLSLNGGPPPSEWIAKLNLMDSVFSCVRAALVKQRSKYFESLRQDLRDLLTDAEGPCVALGEASVKGRITGVPEDVARKSRKRGLYLNNFIPYGIIRECKAFGILPLLTVGPEFISNGQVYEYGKPIDVRITTEKDRILIDASTGRKRMILFSNVTRIWSASTERVFIIASGMPTLLRLEPDVKTKLMGHIRPALGRGVILDKDEIQSAFVEVTNRWCSGLLSSFDYLSELNFLSGRFFNDKAKRYPCFPSIKNRSDNFEEDNALVRLKIPEDRLLFEFDAVKGLRCLPEIYFFCEMGIDPEVVYENRKKLENFNELDQWIGKVFRSNFNAASDQIVLGTDVSVRCSRQGVTFPDLSSAFCDPQPWVEAKNEKKDIFCSWYNKSNYVVVLEDGRVVFFSVSIKQENSISTVGISINKRFTYTLPSPVSEWSFDTIRTGLIAVNGEIVHLVRENRVDKRVLYLERPRFTRNMIESCNRIYTWHVGGSKIAVSPLIDVPGRIRCFAESRKFGIVAIGCDDAKLRIRSHKDGRKIMTAALDDEIPIKVLITKKFGFIVVLTDFNWFIFTVNGTLIKKAQISCKVNKLTTFHSVAGFDYVVFCDENAIVYWFEAMYPEQQFMKKSDYVQNREIHELRVDWRNNCFIAIPAGPIIIWSIDPPPSLDEKAAL
jgi:hypothetical protein